jgi:hypothetical protein
MGWIGGAGGTHKHGDLQERQLCVELTSAVVVGL